MAEPLKKTRTLRLVVEKGCTGRIVLERQRETLSIEDLAELVRAAHEWAGTNHAVVVSLHTGRAPKEPRLR